MNEELFPYPLRLEYDGLIGGTKVFSLTDIFAFRSSYGLIVLPPKTRTDGASTPRLVWPLFPPYGAYFPAAVIHDFLYSPSNQTYTRHEADKIFLEAMYALGIPDPVCSIVYAAVDLFGVFSYKATPMKEEFTQWFNTQNFRNFSAGEFIPYFSKVRNGVKNSFPPKEMWPNIVPTLRILDDLRDHFKEPLYISSTYRDPDYNSAVGSVPGSLHRQFKAVDFTIRNTTPHEIQKVLLAWRSKGKFLGGVGRYPTFVHLDTRGSNATW